MLLDVGVQWSKECESGFNRGLYNGLPLENLQGSYCLALCCWTHSLYSHPCCHKLRVVYKLFPHENATSCPAVLKSSEWRLSLHITVCLSTSLSRFCSQILIFWNIFAAVNGCNEVGCEEAHPLRMKIRNRLLSRLCLQVTKIALMEVLVCMLSISCDAI